MDVRESTSQDPGSEARAWRSGVRRMLLVSVVCLGAGMGANARADYSDVAGLGALEFDGVDDYVNLGNNASLQLSGDMAISAWCKTAEGSVGEDMGIAGKMVSHGGTSCSGFLLFRWLGHFWFLAGPGARYEAIGTDWSYTDSEWHHVAGTIRGGDACLYLDGVLAESWPQICSIEDSGQSAFVGKECSNVDNFFFDGLIDDVRFYSRGLSGAEVADVMSRRPSGSEPGLVGYWAFDELTGQTVYDGSGRGNHGCLGAATAQESSDPKRVLDMSLCGQHWTRSLSLDTYSEYNSSVTNNNYDHAYIGGRLPVGYLPVAGSRQGVLSMSNLRAVGTGYVVAAWASVACGAPVIPLNSMSVSFDYRFDTGGEPAAKGLLVDLRVGNRLVRLGGVAAPLPASPGGNSNGSWGRYSDESDIYASAGETMAIELTLKGCEGTTVQIDNLMIAGRYDCSTMVISGGPSSSASVVNCITNTCDLAGIEGMGLGPEDFYAAVVSCGASIDAGCQCLDETFTCDGFASIDDALYWGWACTESAPFTCGGTLSSAAITPTSAVSQSAVGGCTVSGPLVIAGKAYSYDPYWGDHNFMSDRVFSLNTSCAITGQPGACADDGYGGRIVKDTYGNLYQVHLTRGLVSLATGQSVLAPGLLSFGSTQVGIGWDGLSGVPPIQDAAFDSSGDVYVVPVVVYPTTGSAFRAAARVRPGRTPQIFQLYTTPLFETGAYETGAYEIETDNLANVYVLDKRHWDDSRLLRYHRDSSQLRGSADLRTTASIETPTAFCVSPTGRIWVADQTWDRDVGEYRSQLVELENNYSEARRVAIMGMEYMTGICEEASTGTIWTVGFSVWSDRRAKLDITELLEPPKYGPYAAKVGPYDSVSVDATFLLPDGYQETQDEQLSLPLSIVWKGY